MDARERNATLEDVAALAGVSVATVSRAMRGLPNVAQATRQRVRDAAGELDYRPHPHASRLAGGRTLTIGLALPMLGQWYFAKVLAGVAATLAPVGYDLLLFDAPTPEDRHRLFSDTSPIRQRVDGLIVVGMHLPQKQIPSWARALCIVSVGQEIASIPSISVDNVGAAALAVRHLVNLGHTRIGFIGAGTEDGVYGVSADRRRGYMAELRRHGIGVRREMQVDAALSVDGGRDGMDQLLLTAPPPTAVFAVTDEQAVGAIDSIRRHGFEVPRHVSVVGFDDHDLAAALGLTTIRQSAVRHGERGADLLLRALRGDPPPTRPLRDVAQLVVRATTRPRSDA